MSESSKTTRQGSTEGEVEKKTKCPKCDGYGWLGETDCLGERDEWPCYACNPDGKDQDEDTEPATSGSHLQTAPCTPEAAEEQEKPGFKDWRISRLTVTLEDANKRITSLEQEKLGHLALIEGLEHENARLKADVQSLRHEMRLQTSAVEERDRYREALEKIADMARAETLRMPVYQIAREALS